MTSTRHALAYATLIVLGGGSLAGCGSNAATPTGTTPPSNGTESVDADTQQLASDGNDASASAAQSTHLGNIVFTSVTSADPAKASDEVAGGPTALWPAGCLTREKDKTNPHVVHLTFKECTGPFGLVHLTGEETVTFGKTPDGKLTASFTSENLMANGKPVQHSATADITVNGAERDVDWQGAWTRQNAKGETVSHTSQLTIKVDTGTHCRVENGTAVTDVASREVDTKYENVKLCPNTEGTEGCPSGTVTHTGKKSGKTVTVEFDGSAQAAVTGPGGQTFHVPLVCQP
jgi:hypothetical protein